MKAKKKMTKHKFIGAGSSATLTPGLIYFCKDHPHKDFIWVLNNNLDWEVCFKSQFEEEGEQE